MDELYDVEKAKNKYETARSNLLLMIILTVVNIILLVFDFDIMLLFSATIPYFSVAVGMVMDALGIGLTIAIIELILYLVCWKLCEQHYGWMIFALIMFILDSLALVGIYYLAVDFSGILDAIIHVWVLYYLIIGVKYGYQLNKPENKRKRISENVVEESQIPSAPIRRADDVKHRILLETDYQGYHICYRRVKRVNELVVNGYVYDEVEMLVEFAHSLDALIDGYHFEVGFDGFSHSYINVDNQQIAKKLRLI